MFDPQKFRGRYMCKQSKQCCWILGNGCNFSLYVQATELRRINCFWNFSEMLRISCVRSCSNRPHLSFSKNYVRELVCVRLVFISLVIATDSFAGIGDPCLSLPAFWESLKSGPLHLSLMKWKAPYRTMVIRTLEMGGGGWKGVFALLWSKKYGRVA